MFTKVKDWWSHRSQAAKCRAGICDCELVSIHVKNEGCQKFTRLVHACPVCGRRVVENSVELLADKMAQSYPEIKKTAKPKKVEPKKKAAAKGKK